MSAGQCLLCWHSHYGLKLKKNSWVWVGMWCFMCGKVYAIGILKAFELPDRKDQAMTIGMAQESTLSLFPLNMDHPRGIFLLGCRAAGWVMG